MQQNIGVPEMQMVSICIFITNIFVCTFLIDCFDFQFPKSADENTYDVLQDIAPKLNDIMYKCIWQGRVFNCSKYISSTVTEEGICFVFNALNSHEIYTNEYGYYFLDNFIAKLTWCN